MTGRQFAALLRSLPAEELSLDIAELVDRYDRPTCRDCGRHHRSVWEALACDGFTDARRRRDAARVARNIAKQRPNIDDQALAS